MSDVQWGFSLIEVLVSVAIISMIAVMLGSFLFELNYANSKSKADREVLENARRAMDTMAYEIRGATGVYTPTTTASQLSLETSRYLPTDETTTYLDFFLCGTAVCLKKESQTPIALTAGTVQAQSLQFTRVVNGSSASLKISLTVNAVNPSGALQNNGSVTLSSTIALRSY